MFRHLKPVIFVACLLFASTAVVEAGTWHEYRLAGFKAFNDGDYQGAVRQFETALAVAYEEHAPPDHLGAILENLATSYLAAGQPQRAWEAIERWDKILAASAGEPWVAKHQSVRDELVPLIREALARTESSGDEAPSGKTTNATPAASNYAIHLESLKNKGNVQTSWAQLKATYPSQLSDKSLLVKTVDLGDQGIFYRILAAPYSSKGDADRACKELKGQGQYCAVRSLRRGPSTRGIYQIQAHSRRW